MGLGGNIQEVYEASQFKDRSESNLHDLKPGESVDDFRAYLQGIGKISLLEGREEEVRLSKIIETGQFARTVLEVRNPETRDEVLKANRAALENANKNIVFENKKRAKKDKPEIPIHDVEGSLQRIVGVALSKTIDSSDLRQLVREGDRAKAGMIEANLRLVVSIAKRY